MVPDVVTLGHRVTYISTQTNQLAKIASQNKNTGKLYIRCFLNHACARLRGYPRILILLMGPLLPALCAGGRMHISKALYTKS